MIVFLTIAGEPVPLAQITLRRSMDAGAMDLQLVGHRNIAIGAACSLLVDDLEITATVTASSPGERLTTVSASLPAEVGAGLFAPSYQLSRSNGGIRAPLDWRVLPGDTYQGMIIASCTHTMGAKSPWFTEVRF